MRNAIKMCVVKDKFPTSTTRHTVTTGLQKAVIDTLRLALVTAGWLLEPGTLVNPCVIQRGLNTRG